MPGISASRFGAAPARHRADPVSKVSKYPAGVRGREAPGACQKKAR